MHFGYSFFLQFIPVTEHEEDSGCTPSSVPKFPTSQITNLELVLRLRVEVVGLLLLGLQNSI